MKENEGAIYPLDIDFENGCYYGAVVVRRKWPKTLLNKEAKMQKWECPCGYIYDPMEGDHEHGVDPGTPWEEVPEDWVCPKCGALKEDFWQV